MAKIAIPFFLYAETPLHPGTGAHLGTVDLPIQRERHTAYPTIQGSSLKGVFRSLSPEAGWQNPEIEAIFGPDTQGAEKHAGCISFTDARILLFPVRALGAVFAWTTCLEVLERLRRDLAHAGVTDLPVVRNQVGNDESALVPPNSSLIEGQKSEGPIVLEEYSYSAKNSEEVKQVGEWLGRHIFPADAAFGFWKTKLATDLVLLPSGEFCEFTKTATEIVTRVKLNENKMVQEGPWTEENVPSDSAFYALILVQAPMAENRQPDWNEHWVAQKLKAFDGQRIQIGGDETTGRGFAVVRFGGGSNGKTS